MGKFTATLIFVSFILIVPVFSQANKASSLLDSSSKIHFRINYQGFFDNREFNQVENQTPTTFFGHRFDISGTYSVDSSLSLVLGINPLQEFGSEILFTSIQKSAFIQKNTKKHQFLFGSFPRTHVLKEIPRALFSDTISYYRPNITGLSHLFNTKRSEFGSWFDWTAQKSETQREHFFLGFYAKTSIKKISFLFFANLSHLANTSSRVTQKPLEESLMTQSKVRYSLQVSSFCSYQSSISLLHSLERIRNGSPLRNASSILFENQLSFPYIELTHTLKKGEGHFIYSGDPFYRYTDYARLDIALRPRKPSKLSIQGIYSLHFMEGRAIHQQKIGIYLKN
ncbi:MAG: hypothetical protein ACK4R6_02860 [Spirosomataceae bacterium]